MSFGYQHTEFEYESDSYNINLGGVRPSYGYAGGYGGYSQPAIYSQSAYPSLMPVSGYAGGYGGYGGGYGAYDNDYGYQHRHHHPHHHHNHIDIDYHADIDF